MLEVLEAQDPTSIAVNFDREIAFSDGLHIGEFTKITEELGTKWHKRMMTQPMLAVEFIATMPKGRLPWYKRLQETAWAMITEGFSERVITPGVTTTEDVEWWHREKMQQLNYTTWFMPTVSIIRPNFTMGSVSLAQKNVINYGDLLHVDFGVTALGMNTDTQHMAYVLYPGQTEADIPHYLLEGLKKANRVQDIVKSNMKVGTSGNDILKVCLKQMDSEGIAGKVYSHPIGDWGHSAGTLVGKQDS